MLYVPTPVLIAVMARQIAHMRLLAARSHQVGAGRRSVLNERGRSKYDGAALRALRAERGVGGPKKREGS